MNFVTRALALTLAAGSIVPLSQAQDSKDRVQRDETIFIRKKGDSKEKLRIEVDGDNVTVNGKPLSEYKGNDIQIITGNRASEMRGAMALTLPRASRPPRAQAFPRMNMSPDGLEGLPFSDEKRAFLGVSTEAADGGVKVMEVTQGSAAEKAGLKKDDIITLVGNTKIESSDALYEAISKYKPEEKITISYKRDGRETTTNAVLGTTRNMMLDNMTIAPRAFGFNNDFNSGNFVFNRHPRLGMQVQETDNNSGLKVLDIDEESPAGKAGIKTNDVITHVNGKEVNKLEDIRTLTKDVKEGEDLKVTYKRDNRTENTEIKFPKRLKKADL